MARYRIVKTLAYKDVFLFSVELLHTSTTHGTGFKSESFEWKCALDVYGKELKCITDFKRAKQELDKIIGAKKFGTEVVYDTDNPPKETGT